MTKELQGELFGRFLEKQCTVECLGMTFESDEARREYFLEKLREKLKDPEFRKIEGFPIGEDEDILALSQALAYMLDDPKRDQPTFGLLVNGREFVFVKLAKEGTPKYSLSRAFSILKPENDIYDVLHILKHIGELISR